MLVFCLLRSGGFHLANRKVIVFPITVKTGYNEIYSSRTLLGYIRFSSFVARAKERKPS